MREVDYFAEVVVAPHKPPGEVVGAVAIPSYKSALLAWSPIELKCVVWWWCDEEWFNEMIEAAGPAMV